MATFSDREQAVDRIFGWVAPDNARDVEFNHMPVKTVFSAKVYEWDYEDDSHTDEEKLGTPAITGWVDTDARTVTFNVPEATIYCTICKEQIPISDCTEVTAGELTHESIYGYLHIIG